MRAASTRRMVGDMRIRLLEIDPALGRRLDREEFELARERLTPQCVDLDRGDWQPDLEEPPPGHLGYLVVDGLLIREVLVAGSRSIELLNFGDVVRPWLEDSASFVDASWRVVAPVRLAILDAETVSRASQWPALLESIFDRGLRRARSLAVSSAVQNLRGVEERIEVLMWLLAEHWGRLEPGGTIFIPINLTHETLGVLVGARRPTVSTALSHLAESGSVEQVRGKGWRLRGEPPAPHPDGQD